MMNCHEQIAPKNTTEAGITLCSLLQIVICFSKCNNYPIISMLCQECHGQPQTCQICKATASRSRLPYPQASSLRPLSHFWGKLLTHYRSASILGAAGALPFPMRWQKKNTPQLQGWSLHPRQHPVQWFKIGEFEKGLGKELPSPRPAVGILAG